MLDTQENKLSMYRATDLVLDNNNATWTGFTAFEDAKTELLGKITAIQLKEQQQDAIITGISIDKKTLKAALIGLATDIGGRVTGYATVVNNSELLNAVNFSATQLDKTRDELLGQRCQNIHDRANANLAALAAYGVTAPILVTLQTAINVYITKTPEPRAAKAAKKAVTEQLVLLFKETDKILKLRLDKFMVTYRSSETEFYNSYKAARIIVNLGKTSTKIRVVVKNGSGTAISGASVTLMQNNFPVYGKNTSAEGKASITKVKPGVYDLKVEKAGYATFTESGITFTAGKELARTVTMQGGGTLTSVVREGDVIMGSIVDIDTSDFVTTDSTTEKIIVSGNELLFSAAPAAGPTMGPTVGHVQPGTQNKTNDAFGALVGASDINTFLKVQCLGPLGGHYKITFNNVMVP